MTTTPVRTSQRLDDSANRLTYDDDLFQRSRRVLGIPLVNQTLWRLDGPVPPERIEQLRRGLATGPLNRLVVHSRVPGARDRWVRSPVVPAVVRDAEPVAPEDVLAWADRHVAVDLDPERGPTWALATAPTTDGGTLLSYVTSHVVCDGGAHIGSLVAAAESRDIGRLPVDDLAAAQTPWHADVRDAWQQLVRSVRGVWTAVRMSRDAPPALDAQTSEQTGPRPERAGDDLPYVPPTAVIDCDADEWEAAARRHGGTSNSLLVAIGVEVLLASGRAEAGRPIKVAMPVSLRGEDDRRANATSGVSMVVDTVVDADGVGRVADLSHVRARSRVELAALADGTRRDTLEPLKPLLQMLPDRLLARMARDAAAPLCLCSNLGEMPPGFATPTGTPASSVMLRSVTQDVTPAMMRRTRGGVSTWWSHHGGTATLSVLGMDPDHFTDADELTRHVVEACRRWGVEARPW